MLYLQPYVYQLIKELVEQRKVDKKVPYVAIRNELYSKIISDIKETIDELEAGGLVAHSENINGIELYRVEKEVESEDLER